MPRARKPPSPPGAPTDPRGGARQGQPGQVYPRRTDLTSQKVTTVQGQPYGEAAQQAAAQRAVPMAGPPAQLATASAPAPASQAALVAGGAPFDVGAGFVPPGSLGDPHGPTQRPGEPLTHGISQGPGGGPEVLPLAGQADNIGNLVNRLASMPGATPELQYLSAYLKAGRR